MKIAATHLIAYITSILLSLPAAAQSLADFGNAKLVIENGDLKGEYFYSMENGTPLSFTEDADRDHADFTFEGDFDNNKGGTHWLQCIFRILPPGSGTYLFKDPSTSGDPPKEAQLSLNIDNKTVLNAYSGSVEITNYPGGGGYLIGSFSGTVYNISRSVSYKVLGQFKIKKL